MNRVEAFNLQSFNLKLHFTRKGKRKYRIFRSWFSLSCMNQLCSNIDSLADVIVGFSVIVPHEWRVSWQENVADNTQGPHIWKYLTRLQQNYFKYYLSQTCSCADKVIVNNLRGHKFWSTNKTFNLKNRSIINDLVETADIMCILKWV